MLFPAPETRPVMQLVAVEEHIVISRWLASRRSYARRITPAQARVAPC